MGDEEKISIPKTNSSLPFLAVGGLMLAVAGGLVTWKVAKSSSDEVGKAPAAVSPAPELAATDAQPEAPRRRPPPAPPPPAHTEQPQIQPGASAAASVASASAPGPGNPSACSDPCEGNVTETLSQALRGRGGQARDCYNQALENNPDLVGKLLVKVRIGKSGEACGASVVSDTLNNAQVKSCVLTRFRAGRFPIPNGGCVDTQVPLNFTKRNILPQ